jgi:hypothetical protein
MKHLIFKEFIRVINKKSVLRRKKKKERKIIKLEFQQKQKIVI